jgi:hypothetical protein
MDPHQVFTRRNVGSAAESNLANIRAAGLLLLQTILENAPACGDRDLAIKRLRESIWWAVSAIELEGEV